MTRSGQLPNKTWKSQRRRGEESVVHVQSDPESRPREELRLEVVYSKNFYIRKAS